MQRWTGQFSIEDNSEGVRTACLVRGQPTANFPGIDVSVSLFDKAVKPNRKCSVVPDYGA